MSFGSVGVAIEFGQNTAADCEADQKEPAMNCPIVMRLLTVEMKELNFPREPVRLNLTLLLTMHGS